MTISTDTLQELIEFRDAVGAPWTFLPDAARRVQKDLDIRGYTDPKHDRMIPHTLVLEPGLIVYQVYCGTDSGGDLRRPSCGKICGR